MSATNQKFSPRADDRQPLLPMPRRSQGLAFRIACGLGIVLVTYVAAQFAQVRHAGWLAGGVGLPIAIVVALRAGAPPGPLAERMASLRTAASPRLTVLLGVAAPLFLLVLLPVLVNRLPAVDDYPNHLARMYVIAMHGRDALLDRFYAVDWKMIPNLGMDLLVPPLAAATNVYVAGKAFFVGALLLLLAGPHAIHYALYRRLSFAPLVAVLFVYNGVTTMGVLNYQFGIGLALFAVASWILLRDRAPLLRGAVSAACMLVLFVCHLVAFGCYGLAIGSFELWRLASRPATPRHWLIDAAVLVVPAAIVLPLVLLGPAPDGSYATPTLWGGLHARIDGLRFLLETYAPLPDLLALLAIVAGFAWAVWRRTIYLHPFGWIALAVFGLVYLILPNQIQGTWGAADRLPVAVLSLLIGALHWDLGASRARHAFLAAVTALALFRTSDVAVAFSRFTRITRAFDTSLALIPPGSRVLVAEQHDGPADLLDGPIQQLPLLAVIERSCLVSLTYAHPLQQVLTVRPPYRAAAGGYADAPIPLAALLDPPRGFAPGATPLYAPSGRVYWADWVHSYDYLYVINGHSGDNPAPQRLRLLNDGDRFQLFRIRHG